jgi:regulator of protease activity HflC (stomatin/prohibitin superfamily)
VNKQSAFDLFVKYGGLKQFEDRILDPQLRSASKNAIAKYKAEQIIQNRMKVIADIEEGLKKTMAAYPITLDSVQIENIVFPQKYIKSIETKQTEKNLADAEKHKLARQQLEAQRSVNTANAKRDSDKAMADGKAYVIEKEAEAKAKAIMLEGDAKAKVIKLKAEAIKGNPELIKYQHTIQWNGQLPKMITGDSTGLLLNVPGN